MISITDANGLDLVANPPQPVAIISGNPSGVVYRITAYVRDSGSLPVADMTVTLTGPMGHIVSGSTSGMTLLGDTWTISQDVALPPGANTVSIEAVNRRYPTPDTAKVSHTYSVTVSSAKQAPFIYGPILPRDTGYPNAEQWTMDISNDIRLLESSVKMLLITSKGERVHQPGYGTGLRALLFESSLTGIEDLVQQEIIDALSTWEPRVAVRYMSIVRGTDRSVWVALALTSRLSGNDFELGQLYTP